MDFRVAGHPRGETQERVCPVVAWWLWAGGALWGPRTRRAFTPIAPFNFVTCGMQRATCDCDRSRPPWSHKTSTPWTDTPAPTPRTHPDDSVGPARQARPPGQPPTRGRWHRVRRGGWPQPKHKTASGCLLPQLIHPRLWNDPRLKC